MSVLACSHLCTLDSSEKNLEIFKRHYEYRVESHKVNVNFGECIL